jgi:protein required for attachment to host cells
MAYAWVVVADSARARVFSVENASGQLEPVEQLLSPEARLHERDLSSDRPGRSFDSFGSGRHSTDTATSAKDQIAANFAKELAQHLKAGCNDRSFERLVIIAEPQFLGLLNKSLPTAVDKLVSLRIDKDLTKETEQEIRERLPKRI